MQTISNTNKIKEDYLFSFMSKKYFNLSNRRFLGSKQKLLAFIEKVVNKVCPEYDTFCDIFAGTGVVGQHFNKPDVKVISNDLLVSNYIPLNAFLNSDKSQLDENDLEEKINYLNNLQTNGENYFSKHFGGRYFSIESAKKIGLIREEIDEITKDQREKYALITSLIYAADKIANTVGHYDAYRQKMYIKKPLELLTPQIPNHGTNLKNEIFNEDANSLIERIECDILYMDPPYNSRQYSDTYHVLENLAEWKKPKVYGKAQKMSRRHIKSNYSSSSASETFEDLIKKARAKHIIVSYNNTGSSKHGRSNAKISDDELVTILSQKGKVEIFEQKHKAYTAGKSITNGHTERLFYCEVK